MCQFDQHLGLCAGDKGGRVSPSGFDTAHLDRAILENPEIAVGDRHTRILARRQKGYPAVNSLEGDGQAGALVDRLQHRLEIGDLGGTRLSDPHAVYIEMQHFKAQVFGSLLGAQERLPPVSGDCLVGLDAPETGVFVAQVAKTGHQEPFVG